MIQLPLYPRYIQPRLLEGLADSPVVLMHGPSQCGKNTLVKDDPLDEIKFDLKYPSAYGLTYEMEVIKMTTLSATEARKSLYNLLDDVALSHAPIQIVGKRHSAVLISEDDWRAIQETLYLTSIPGMRKSITKGIKTPVTECSEELAW